MGRVEGLSRESSHHLYASSAAIADEQGSNIANLLYYDTQNQQTICDNVSQWEGWNENGAIGLGWPLLQWQVEW